LALRLAEQTAEQLENVAGALRLRIIAAAVGTAPRVPLADVRVTKILLVITEPIRGDLVW
jgi:hypothetical protein